MGLLFVYCLVVCWLVSLLFVFGACGWFGWFDFGFCYCLFLFVGCVYFTCLFCGFVIVVCCCFGLLSWLVYCFVYRCGLLLCLFCVVGCLMVV